MESLLKAILAWFNADTSAGTVYVAVSGRFNIPKAPDNITFPHIVGTVISDVPDYVFGNNPTEQMRFQFSIFSDLRGDAGALEVTQIRDKLRTRFDDAALTFAGSDYTTVEFTRDIATGPDESADRSMGTQDFRFRAVKL